MVLQGVGDIAQEANIGNRISRAEKNASCFDRVADVLDLREAQRSAIRPDRQRLFASGALRQAD